jgi:hypothetical protein
VTAHAWQRAHATANAHATRWRWLSEMARRNAGKGCHRWPSPARSTQCSNHGVNRSAVRNSAISIKPGSRGDANSIKRLCTRAAATGPRVASESAALEGAGALPLPSPPLPLACAELSPTAAASAASAASSDATAAVAAMAETAGSLDSCSSGARNCLLTPPQSRSTQHRRPRHSRSSSSERVGSSVE